jgi:tetratricopeptide (TPR) repeat protein
VRRQLAVLTVALTAWISACGAATRPAVSPSAPHGASGAADDGQAGPPAGADAARKAALMSRKPLVLEQQDPQLAASLKRLSASPTAASQREVADRYRTLGVLDAAFDHYRLATVADPRDAAAYEGLARVWRDWGFPDVALGAAHRAVFYAPDSASAHNTMGTVLQALGQFDTAEAAYERANQLDPGAVYAVSNLCYLAFLEGRFERALTTCRAAIALDPAFIAARNNLALTHAAAGRLDLARTEFLDAGSGAIASFNMGIVYMAVHDYGRAEASFEDATKADPAMNIARVRAAEARRLGGSTAREAGESK